MNTNLKMIGIMLACVMAMTALAGCSDAAEEAAKNLQAENLDLQTDNFGLRLSEAIENVKYEMIENQSADLAQRLNESDARNAELVDRYNNWSQELWNQSLAQKQEIAELNDRNAGLVVSNARLDSVINALRAENYKLWQERYQLKEENAAFNTTFASYERVAPINDWWQVVVRWSEQAQQVESPSEIVWIRSSAANQVFANPEGPVPIQHCWSDSQDISTDWGCSAFGHFDMRNGWEPEDICFHCHEYHAFTSPEPARVQLAEAVCGGCG